MSCGLIIVHNKFLNFKWILKYTNLIFKFVTLMEDSSKSGGDKEYQTEIVSEDQL